jgi:putative component of toxin-antitoxin plasmid stabilization module
MIDTKECETLYKYKGCVDQHLLGNVSYNIKNNSDFTQLDKIETKRNKLIILAAELLQNVMKHANNYLHENSVCHPSNFDINYNKEEGSITFKIINVLDEDTLNNFVEKLNYANSLSKEEIQTAYINQLKNGTFSDKHGAGLGLFELRRISGSKIEYSVSQNSTTHYNFAYSINYIL